MEAASLVYHLSPPIQKKPQGCVEDELCCSEGDGDEERERANNQPWRVGRLGAVKPSTETICSHCEPPITFIIRKHRRPVVLYNKKSMETTVLAIDRV